MFVKFECFRKDSTDVIDEVYIDVNFIQTILPSPYPNSFGIGIQDGCYFAKGTVHDALEIIQAARIKGNHYGSINTTG